MGTHVEGLKRVALRREGGLGGGGRGERAINLVETIKISKIL